MNVPLTVVYAVWFAILISLFVKFLIVDRVKSVESCISALQRELSKEPGKDGCVRVRRIKLKPLTLEMIIDVAYEQGYRFRGRVTVNNGLMDVPAYWFYAPGSGIR